MLLDLVQVVHILFDREIEAPGIVHACLPHIARDAILLGVEGGMQEVLKRSADCLSNAR
jgi:hypothetical protein